LARKRFRIDFKGGQVAITEIASLSVVKQYLRIPVGQALADDSTITIMMRAAQEAVERELGHIVAKTIRAERHDGGKCEIWLRELPVLYVSNIEEGWGYYDQELDDQEVNQIPALSIWAYSLDDPKEGLVTRRSQGNVTIPFVIGRNNVRADYVVGRNEIPANAELAFCELVSFWYRNSQLRAAASVATPSGSGQTAFGAINADFTRSQGETSFNAGIPSGILELLKPDRRRPVIG
jgi:hypothetical protein